jgi:hypothetical protein
MGGPRMRARRNLAIFWLVVVGAPLLVVAGCLALEAATWPSP